jgi:hypothetical protein
MSRTRWLWLPAEDGTVTVADPVDFPADFPVEFPAAGLPSAGAEPVLRGGQRRMSAADHGGDLPGTAIPAGHAGL